MDAKAILADLREQFGRQNVLYADDLAELLGKSKQALANLIHRGGLPLTIKKVGGRLCVSIYDVAEWLANGGEAPKKAANAINLPAPLPTPARHRQSLGKGLLALQMQRDFLSELSQRLEAILIAPPPVTDKPKSAKPQRLKKTARI